MKFYDRTGTKTFWGERPMVGMVTCPRKVDYSGRTLVSIVESGLPTPYIYHDVNKEGPVSAWFMCLYHLTSLARPGQPILILQDDAEFFTWREPHQSDALFSLYSFQRPKTDNWCEADTSPRRRQMECDGGVAFLMPFHIAREIVANASLDMPRIGLPAFLGSICHELEIPYFVSPYNQWRHTGEVPARDGYPDGFKWNTKQERPFQ